MENVIIYGITSNHYPICIAPPDEFGELPDTPYDTWPHSRYATAYHNSDVEQLESDGVKNVNNALWHIPHYEPHEIVRSDTLHTLLLGILIHLMKWVSRIPCICRAHDDLRSYMVETTLLPRIYQAKQSLPLRDAVARERNAQPPTGPAWSLQRHTQSDDRRWSDCLPTQATLLQGHSMR